jgi:hypothetical protein
VDGGLSERQQRRGCCLAVRFVLQALHEIGNRARIAESEERSPRLDQMMESTEGVQEGTRGGASVPASEFMGGRAPHHLLGGQERRVIELQRPSTEGCG